MKVVDYNNGSEVVKGILLDEQSGTVQAPDGGSDNVVQYNNATEGEGANTYKVVESAGTTKV